MKTLRILTAGLAAAGAALAVYSYYYEDTLTTIDSTKWYQNGTLTATSQGLTSTGNGSLISKVAVPTGADYEVKTTLTLISDGGAYVQYLRASNNDPRRLLLFG